MRLKNRLSLLMIASTVILGYSNYANAAGSANGEIAVTLDVTAGCTVGVANDGQWGTLNFGTVSEIDNDINSTVVWNSGLNITCSNLLPYSLTFANGSNFDTTKNVRRLVYNTTNFIPYRLYKDAAYATEISSTAVDYTGTGTVDNVPIYGRILIDDQNALVAPAAGTYTDTVAVTLTW
ncbi:MAG: spore coat U domain-containing protein [Acinetobacter towneri]|nr:spore coat U domain-containing protein [Acinetobacter towneri]